MTVSNLAEMKWEVERQNSLSLSSNRLEKFDLIVFGEIQHVYEDFCISDTQKKTNSDQIRKT